MKTLVSLFAFSIMLFACTEKEIPSKKDSDKVILEENDSLSDLTFEGANTLTCLVNGKKFSAKPKSSLIGVFKPNLSIYYDSVLLIQALDRETLSGNQLTLTAHMNPSAFAFPLYYLESLWYTRYIDLQGDSEKEFRIIDSEPNYLRIIAMDSEIVVGTFAFTAVSENGDTVRISDGRFDIARD